MASVIYDKKILLSMLIKLIPIILLKYMKPISDLCSMYNCQDELVIIRITIYLGIIKI